jgi:internalin A
VFDLSHLEILELRDNSIQVVPARILRLANLKRLDLVRNPVKEVPDLPGLILDWPSYLLCSANISPGHISGMFVDTDQVLPETDRLVSEIIGLPGLQHLSIGVRAVELRRNIPVSRPSEEVERLISMVGKLSHLESLAFFGVLLKEVPIDIGRLKRLQSLSMEFTRLRRVPDGLAGLRALADLDLSNNRLKYLPDFLSRLPRLETLNLDGNNFTEIPAVVFRIKALKYLSLRGPWWADQGLLRQIPADILSLPSLQTLEVDDQPIEEPPPEVVQQGLAAIKNYWRQREEAGVDYLCEAKLIIVGEAGAGKTSLAEKIRSIYYQLQPEQRSTEGIEVIRWSFPAAIRVRRDKGEELLQRDFKVNIWDFGGQEVYHATHQFFLTRRSLYLLVTDDRKEDTDFNYWLQTVELLSDRSPLLIVQNEKQDRQRDVDFGGLRARFPGLKEAYRTNLATNRGLNELVAAIRQELERLPHIGTPLPKTWNLVREVLEQDARSYISLEEYLSICAAHGFVRREDKLQLSSYLHDLGICLHFQDDPILKNTVILKPKWGTDAVYRVLDDHLILDRRGCFGREDLARIWVEETYAPMRDELLRLMMKFQLCYQLPDVDAFIAPQLLSPTRPSYSWDGAGNLVLRYEYVFMPKGIITRFIVAVNHLIADPTLVWKSGVILDRDGTRGEVIEEYSRRKIVVRVSGPDTRGLLAIVDDQMERIHNSFAHLKYDKLLPCHCEVCRDRDEPYAYLLSELRDFARDGAEIQCRTSRKLVDAEDLIRDVLPWAMKGKDLGLSAIVPQCEADPPELTSRKEVFVSYAWTTDSQALVDRLEDTFRVREITLLRDKNAIRYRDSIGDFMKRMGRSQGIVVVLSKKYLESKNCMFELTEIAARGDIRDRVFPIVMEDANIYDALGRLDYIEYWEKKIQALDSRVKKVSAANLQGIREDLDLYTKIRNTVAGIVDILGDMNALTAEQLEGANFEQVLRALEARLEDGS